MRKRDYLYIKEIGVDIRIKGVMSMLTVMLTNLFDTEDEARQYLIDHGWKEDPESRKWFRDQEQIQETENGPKTDGILTISLPKHTTAELENALFHHSETNELGIVTVYKYPYGYIVDCGESPEKLKAHKKLIFPELYSLMEYAWNHNCRFLMLDNEGPVIPGLPLYDR